MSGIIVFGAKGQLASSLRELRPGLIFVGHEELDLAQTNQIESFLNIRTPRIIINAAAYTAVDKAESEPELCRKINHFAPVKIAHWCKQNGAKFFHISTDYVFDGTKKEPYVEADPTNPLGVYGLTKRDGEQALLAQGAESLIFRTSWVYSPYGANFVKTMLRLGQEKESISVVADQTGNPTYALDLARAILLASDNIAQGLNVKTAKQLSGLYHVTGLGSTTWHQFATEIFAKARELGVPLKVKEVKKITTFEYPTPAARPLNSRLASEKVQIELGITMPPWNKGLEATIRRINANPRV